MRGRVAALLVLVGALVGVQRPAGLGDVREVRHWSYETYTRVVVELDRPLRAPPELHRLAADAAAERPERLYLDLEGVWVGRDYSEGIDVGDGLLRAVRIGQNTLRTSRLVLDLQRYDRHRLLVLAHPDRVVIDVYGGRRGGGDARGETPPGGSLPAGLRPIRTVVVDPGHGGRDPGAIGVGGLREKQVTLRVARSLGEKLEKRGYRVIYTREKDRTMSLEERTAIAESEEGDVFISIHANAARRRSVHGIETYYLDENHERHALNLAARENGITRTQVNVLQQTLAKLHMEEVSPHSRRLAEVVQEQMVSGFSKTRRPQDLGVKRGPFYVLFLSDMPAILVEVGFLTHRNEAKRLRDGGYLDELAEQIARGVERYRGEQDVRLARIGAR